MLNGLPIDGGKSFRAALRRYKRNQNNTTWDALAHKIVPNTGGRTVWQLWVQFDPDNAPRSLSPYILGKECTPAEQWQNRRPSVAALNCFLGL